MPKQNLKLLCRGRLQNSTVVLAVFSYISLQGKSDGVKRRNLCKRVVCFGVVRWVYYCHNEFDIKNTPSIFFVYSLSLVPSNVRTGQLSIPHLPQSKCFTTSFYTRKRTRIRLLRGVTSRASTYHQQK